MTSPTTNTPNAIDRVYHAVSNLLMPAFGPLHQLFMERKQARNDKQNQLVSQQEEVRIEGYEAAMRLVMPEVDQLQNMNESYFSQIKKFTRKMP